MISLNKPPNLLLFISILLLPLINSHPNSPLCNATCAGTRLSYPFGFSGGCPIPLTCTAAGSMLLLRTYPILSISPSKIRVSLPPLCTRPLRTLRSLFTRHFAPSSANALLLFNCSAASSPCSIPAINVHLESLTCANNTAISCLYNRTTEGVFYRDERLLDQCEFLLSSISSEAFNVSGVSLDISVMELVWWLPGRCEGCDEDAVCVQVLGIEGGGYRCQCRDGFVGDGFSGGSGCQKASCNLAKYWSGDCGGAARLFILIGGTLAGALIPICIGLLCCYIRRRRRHPKSKGFTKIRLSQVSKIPIPIFPYKDIQKATHNFSDHHRLGAGAFATVYAAKLNHQWAAIKRIKHTDTPEQITTEIKLISAVHHPNLVRLLGCSLDHGEQILVYEFMPNGTLAQHLQRLRGDGLAWGARLTIASETAQAIAYLHSAIDPPIYHRDIKSTNILLDFNLRSKVADFGLSRLGKTEISHISTAPQGTPGYLDPQYHQNFQLSDKSDVYSFGVVLVEIITALKVVDFSRPPNEVNLAALAVDRIGKGKLGEIIDPFIDVNSDEWVSSSVNKVAELAFRCLAYERDMRPSMVEVAAELERIRLNKWADLEEIQRNSCSSNLSSLLSFDGKKEELASRGNARDDSPISVEDSWVSEQSSPSSSSLLSTVTQ